MTTNCFLEEATARGFVFQCTDPGALAASMHAAPITAYIGFDCTADSLHVGSLVQIMILRLLQKHGHKPLVLLGGGTTRIGDPSGKDESRQLLTDETIAANMAGIRRCFTPFLRFGEGPSDAMLANNADWLDALGYISLLRDVGIHFTINRMLSFDSVKLRLDRRAAADVPRIQLHDTAKLRLPRTQPPSWRHSADRRVRSMGQYRCWNGTDPPHGR